MDRFPKTRKVCTTLSLSRNACSVSPCFIRSRKNRTRRCEPFLGLNIFFFLYKGSEFSALGWMVRHLCANRSEKLQTHVINPMPFGKASDHTNHKFAQNQFWLVSEFHCISSLINQATNLLPIQQQNQFQPVYFSNIRTFQRQATN